MATPAVVIENRKTDEVTEAVYEHPFIVRLCHWVNAVALFVMVGSGLQIFRAFPSFGSKIPEKVLINWPKSLAIGGWLGGALQWHLTFMWIYGSGLVYLGYQIFSGNYKPVLFARSDIRGVWPMVRHYFFSDPNRLREKRTTHCRNMRTHQSSFWACCRLLRASPSGSPSNFRGWRG
jgi:thiosulfate reductase cytochrome b subunit